MKKWFVTFTSAALIGFGGMSAAHADHEEGTVNCGDFETGQEVWEFWESHDYSSENDPEGLDGDSDGVPCESLTLDAGLEQTFLDHDAAMTGENGENGNGEGEGTEGTNNNGNNEEAEENHNNDNNNDHNDADNNANHNDNNHDDEGNEMPATATSYPTLALMALLAAGAGGMMLMRRRTTATE